MAAAAPMHSHRYVASLERSVSVGPPLASAANLGVLTLPGFLGEVVDRFGDSEVVVEHLPDGGVLRWTYRDLARASRDVAKGLTAIGLAKGERVGVLMTNRAEFLPAVFGTALAGGVATPLSTFSTARELAQLLETAACSVLLFEANVLGKDFVHLLRDLEPGIALASPGALASTRFPFLRRLIVLDGQSGGAIDSWERFLAAGAAVREALVDSRKEHVSPADPAVLFFSSGSTALPKGILSAHRGVAIQLWRMGPQQGLPPGVRSWTANGFFWSGNFAMIVGGTLASGGTLVLQRTFKPERAIALMAKERVSFPFAWPHQWQQLIAAPNWLSADLSALSQVDRGSPVTDHPLVDTDWVEPRHCYGNTETFTLSTAYPANTLRDIAGDSHGLPLPGNVLKIVEPLTGETVPVGVRGEVAIKGPTLMLGYLGAPLDETLDDEGFFRTGDGGYIDADGRLFWEGRLNDIIKSGGANVSPAEIDDVIRTCPGVKLTQTVGVPHATLGELIVTCIVPHRGANLEEEAVRRFARERIASYKVPKRILFFEPGDLQLTGSAKVKTAELRSIAGERLGSGDA